MTPVPPGVVVRADGVWERQSAHYPLAEVRKVIATFGTGVFGVQAIQGFTLMQLRPQQAVAALLALKPSHFFKSMTSERDPTHTLWQDVYHGPTDSGLAYIKFMLWYPAARSSNAPAPAPKLVISFKRL